MQVKKKLASPHTPPYKDKALPLKSLTTEKNSWIPKRMFRSTTTMSTNKQEQQQQDVEEEQPTSPTKKEEDEPVVSTSSTGANGYGFSSFFLKRSTSVSTRTTSSCSSSRSSNTIESSEESSSSGLEPEQESMVTCPPVLSTTKLPVDIAKDQEEMDRIIQVKRFWEEKLHLTMERLAKISTKSTTTTTTTTTLKTTSPTADKDDDIFHLLLKLYAHQDIMEELFDHIEANGKELEFYLPQVCTFLMTLVQASDSQPEILRKKNQLECFLLSRSGKSLVFAHRLTWFFKANDYRTSSFKSQYVSITMGHSSEEEEAGDLSHAIGRRGGLAAVLMNYGLTGEEIQAAQKKNQPFLYKQMQQAQERLISAAFARAGGKKQVAFFQHTLEFVERLTNLADKLIVKSLPRRNNYLRASLLEISEAFLPSKVLYVPVGNTCHRIQAIHLRESFCFSTKERVPYFLCLEVIDYNSEQDTNFISSGQRFDHRSSISQNVMDQWKNTSKALIDSSSLHPKKETTTKAKALANEKKEEEEDDDETPQVYEHKHAEEQEKKHLLYPQNDEADHEEEQEIDGEEADDEKEEEEEEEEEERVTQVKKFSWKIPAPKRLKRVGSSVMNSFPLKKTWLSSTTSNKSLTSTMSTELGDEEDHEDHEDHEEEFDYDVHEIQTPKTRPKGRAMAQSMDFIDETVWSENFDLNDELTDSESPDPNAGDSCSNDREKDESQMNSPIERPTIVFKEKWFEKEARLRLASPFGKTKGWRLLPVIVKSNDDLRQEQFAAQLIAQSDRIFQHYTLPLWMRPYNVIATSATSGLIEAIPDTISLDSLKKNDPTYTNLLDFFLRQYGPRRSKGFLVARRNFVESLAAYSMISYVFQIKDRHNGNILLDAQGHLIHIDFGFLLTNSPGSNLNFEKAPFKLTDEFIQLMGGPRSMCFRYFRSLCIRAYLALRRDMEKIVLLVEMMLMANDDLPCFAGGKDKVIEGLKNRLKPDTRTSDCQQFINGLIDQSMNNWRTRWYDKYQRAYLGIL